MLPDHGLPTDPSHDVLRSRRPGLDAFFEPKAVAVVGATDAADSVGRQVLWNLLSNPFGGTVYPVNPKYKSVLGVRAFPRLADAPERIDLALIATPAPTVPDMVSQCMAAGVGAAIILSAGFRDIGEEGAALEAEIVRRLNGHPMRLLGPNSLGVLRPHRHFNASCTRATPLAGKVAIASQSGALLGAILDWGTRENVGFSAAISVGSMLDIGWGEALTFLGDDPKTETILLYMESVGDARAFLSALRDVALSKPVIVLKSGRTRVASQAAISHTGHLVAADDVLNAAFRRSGVLRVNTISGLFYMAEALSKQPRPKGNRLAIVTNAGGPGVLAVDALVEQGGALADLSPEALTALRKILPAETRPTNPIDLHHDATPARYGLALEQALKDPNSDGTLVILTPQASSNPKAVAEEVLMRAKGSHKPVITAWMGGGYVSEGLARLNEGGIPTFSYPDTAAEVFDYMWRYSYNLRGIFETPAMPDDVEGLPDRRRVHALLDAALADGRTLLSEQESKAVLAAYGFTTTEPRVAATADEAVAHANALGYPVVVKVHSHTITHKFAAGGVFLNLPNAAEVREAYQQIRGALASADRLDEFLGVTVQPMVRQRGIELILGSTADPEFGPVLLFGAVAQRLRQHAARAVGLPPLNTTLARRMMEQTRVYPAVQSFAGGTIKTEVLEEHLVRFAQLVHEQPRIREIDLNPLLASPTGFTALDARIVLHDPAIPDAALPRPAIRPYPLRYVEAVTLRNGEVITIRPIRPEDEPAVVSFHSKIDDQSIYLRYASMMKLEQRVAHDRLARKCFIDYDREMALVAERDVPGERPEIVGIGRLSRVPRSFDREYGLIVLDEYQGQGLGTEVLRRLVQVGRDEGAARITADILRQNRPMQRVSQKLGFRIEAPDDFDDPMVRAILDLDPVAGPR